MTAEAAGAVPDDVIEEAAAAFVLKAYGPGCDVRPSDIDEMRAALSVPSVAEVFARDAKVREIVQGLDRGVIHEHPCAGPCLGCGAGPDESCNPPCRCDEGEDCRVAVLLEADRAPLRALAALYSEADR